MTADESAPSLELLRTLAAALGLAIPDADLERVRPEVAALWRYAARLRRFREDRRMPDNDSH